MLDDLVALIENFCNEWKASVVVGDHEPPGQYIGHAGIHLRSPLSVDKLPYASTTRISHRAKSIGAKAPSVPVDNVYNAWMAGPSAAENTRRLQASCYEGREVGMGKWRSMESREDNLCALRSPTTGRWRIIKPFVNVCRQQNNRTKAGYEELECHARLATVHQQAYIESFHTSRVTHIPCSHRRSQS